jgi:hypothetical protein
MWARPPWRGPLLVWSLYSGSRRVATELQSSVAPTEIARTRHMRAVIPRQISATAMRYPSLATSASSWASRMLPRCGGPPSRANTQKLSHILHQSTAPLGRYFVGADAIGARLSLLLRTGTRRRGRRMPTTPVVRNALVDALVGHRIGQGVVARDPHCVDLVDTRVGYRPDEARPALQEWC